MMIPEIAMDDLNPVEGKPNEFVSEASTLGWAPGLWPQTVAVGSVYCFFLQGVTRDREGDVTLATYTTRNGRFILTVLND
jgi:hypothetical protein